MVFAKGLRPLHVATIIVAVRILSVFLVQTWYVPDEYWQTLEVAHKQAFGYGALTWEWKKGIRSYLYPSVVAVFYTILRYTGLDWPEVVIVLPRILQALLSAVADYRFYKWSGERKWALFLVLTSWFWFYTSGRTLLQTLEACLVTIALSYFPFEYSGSSRQDNRWLWLACLCVWVRPSSAPLWIVLAAYHLLKSQERLKLVLQTYLPIGLVTSSLMIALDSYFHGSLIVTPYEFFKYNILNDVGSFYGQHPWYWYLSTGVPATLGTPLAATLLATLELRVPRRRVLLVAVGAQLVVLSCIPHKEFRFVLPLLPILLYLAQDVIVRWSRNAVKWQLYLVSSLLLMTSLPPALYCGLRHQAGVLGVMDVLRTELHNRSSVMFLMPCHSTPLYSHLHMNVTTRYLTCEPDRPVGQVTEAESFFNNPSSWWRTELATHAPPHVVVMFDTLRGRTQGLLRDYKLAHTVQHTQFPSGEVGENVLVFKRTERVSDVGGGDTV